MTHSAVVVDDDAATCERCGELIGASNAMQSVYELVERAAPSDASVLVTGESGTGKEVLARALHEKSDRHAGPFVSVNCAALPEALLESELFGHTKGAFTDAKAAREGLMLRATAGTLFLDEIGEMPLGLQPKLLRVLQERVVRPVGSDREIPIDVRFIAATNRDLELAIEERRFRQDLFYRINVVQIPLPPLRSRGGDVQLLAAHFLRRFAERSKRSLHGLSPAAERCLAEYPWPGNVRELANSMERAMILARGDCVQLEDLPEKVRRPEKIEQVRSGDASAQPESNRTSDVTAWVPLGEIEREYILRVIDAVHGNKSQAAIILGLDRKTLYRKLEQYGHRIS